MLKSLLRFFSSVKLAIVLIIIITAASGLGTLIPQGRSAAEYAARYPVLSSLLIRLEITQLYHSWWYISLLFLFSLNIIICTLTRLSPKLRKAFKPRLDTGPKMLLTMKFNDRIRKNWGLETAKHKTRELLSAFHYRLKEKTEGQQIYLLARKKTWGLFGSDFVHLGLLVILAGGIISGFSGLRTNLSISEGQILDVPEADFQIRLDRFETEFYPNGSVKDWKSHLSVIEEGQSLLTKVVEVNHPLSYKGFVFYQSSYGWDWTNPTLEIWIKKTEDPSYLKKAEMRIGERVELEEKDMELAVLQFVPDFIIDENNRVQTRSRDPNNPAAFIEGFKTGERIFSGWIFAKFPDFSRLHSNVETDLSFELKNFKTSQYSGIQVAKDPGVNLIWLGCILLMAGLFIAFYWPPREIKVLIEESHNKTDAILGGTASKNREAFQAEFEKITTTLRRSK